jgi:hypothetical protein
VPNPTLFVPGDSLICPSIVERIRSDRAVTVRTNPLLYCRGIKGCRMASRAVGRSWHGARAERRDMSCKKLSGPLSGRVPVLSLADAKRSFLCPSRANDQLTTSHYILCDDQKLLFVT